MMDELNELEPTENELIEKFADVCDKELEARVRREMFPRSSNVLHVLVNPRGGEKELAEVYAQVFAEREIGSAQFAKIKAAVKAFDDHMLGKQVQVSVFECIFSLLKYAMRKVKVWDEKLVREFQDLLKFAAVDCDANFWRVDERRIRIRWEGDQSYMEFVFPKIESAGRP